MTTKRNALLVAGLLVGVIGVGNVWAHGNVVPQAVETKGLTPIKDTGVPLDADGWAANNPYRKSPEHDRAVEIGSSAYNQNCAACHGLEAKSGGIAPDLRMLDEGDAGDEWFVERVRHGAVRDGRVYMPKMADYLSQEALWAVRTYLDSVRVEE
ncbi:cytochrome c-550 PedF [Pseudomonas sp. PDM05]|jgi:cytochrome c-550 PedF|uniref:cytochrome c-550 PedF n=1 Tax=Pseudomonas sp. PDM05 TaxID=2769301 RepID=UPI001782CBC1|nr:cytochrome c-550 PedF [Pseudomonas sp. PDM05]MBD9456404.1 cytochrome c-550 PedF [Pseudomonas sp. PDM05]